MDEAAIKKYVDRYEAAYKQYGYSSKGLCSSGLDRSDIRYAALAGGVLKTGGSVLDVGCGFGDLYQFLRRAGWEGDYCGIDLVPSLVNEARIRHPGARILLGDASRGLMDVGQHDYVIACGAMNLRLPNGDNEGHIIKFTTEMFAVAKVAVIVDFMTTLVDFQDPEAWHTDPDWVLREAQKLTRRMNLKADYLPFEFCLTLFKDQAQLRGQGSIYERELT